MVNFLSLLKDVLDEQNKTLQNLFTDKVLPKNTLYKYKQRYPSLTTLLKLANYLGVDVDYLLGLSSENHFKPYKLKQPNLYINIIALIENAGLSQRQFCKNLNYSRANLLRWKLGVIPSVKSLIEISNYFNFPINDLLN